MLGLGDTEPVDPAKVLRMNRDITIVRRPFEGNISGCFLRGQPSSVVILNSKRTVGHQNFTLAHEFYHVEFEPELQGSVCPIEDASDDRPDSERLADEFAANFLVPAEGIDELMYRQVKGERSHVDMASLIEMEQYFGVSHRAMLRRMKETGWLDDEKVEEFKEGITSFARLLGYDTSLYSKPENFEILSPYVRLARDSYEKGKITWGKFCQLLGEAGLGDLIGAEEETCVENEDRER